MSSESQIFDCPACGAPLEYPTPNIDSLRCPFCNHTILVPHAQAAQQPKRSQITQAALQEILDLARREEMTAAVKRYSALFDTDLEEAFEDIEKLKAGTPVYKRGLRIIADGSIENLELPSPHKLQPWQISDVAELVALTNTQKQIEAIQKLRGMFPIGFQEAKKMVEELAKGQSITYGNTTLFPNGTYIKTDELPPRFANLAGSPQEAAQLAHFIQHDELDKAAQLYRRIYDCSRTDAQKAVERLAHGDEIDNIQQDLKQARLYQQSTALNNISYQQENEQKPSFPLHLRITLYIIIFLIIAAVLIRLF